MGSQVSVPWNDMKLTRVSNAEGAAQTDIECDEIDMEGFSGVIFIALFGTIDGSAVTSLKAQQDTVTGMGSAADLLGTSISIADTGDDKLLALVVDKPQEQFVRCVVVRGTSDAVVDGVIAIQYGAAVKPPDHDSSTVEDSEIHVSPIEGTP